MSEAHIIDHGTTLGPKKKAANLIPFSIQVANQHVTISHQSKKVRSKWSKYLLTYEIISYRSDIATK